MKKRIFLIVILIILTTVGVFAYTQRDNIMGVIYSFQYSSDEIESLIESNDENLKSELEEIIGHPIRDFTEEEKKQIDDGTVSKKEVIEKIIYEELEKSLTNDSKSADGSNSTSLSKGEYIGPSDFQNDGNTSGKTKRSENESRHESKIKDSSSNTNSIETKSGVKNNISDSASAPNDSTSSTGSSSYYMMELYGLKSEYIGRLDGMVSAAISEYKSLDKKDQTRSKQLEIGSSYVSKASALEKQCDNEVASILKNLEAELIKEGKSTSIISTIKSSYTTEKNLKRAYYLNMFK